LLGMQLSRVLKHLLVFRRRDNITISGVRVQVTHPAMLLKHPSR
jgi:hypothetical protein